MTFRPIHFQPLQFQPLNIFKLLHFHINFQYLNHFSLFSPNSVVIIPVQ